MMKSTTIHYIPAVYVYDVVPSIMALSFARGDDDSLAPSQYKVTCGYVKRSKKTTVSVADQPIGFENNTYQIYYRYLIGSTWSQWWTYTGGISVKSDTTCSAYEFCISKLVSHDNVNDSTIIARKTIPVSKDGQSAVQVSLSPSTILHKKQSDDAYYVVDVSVKRGKKKNTSFGMYDFSLPLGVDEYAILQPSDSNGNKNQVQFKVSENNVPTGEITFKVSLDGVDYEQSIPIKTVADGIQGIQGLQGPSVRGPQIWQDVAEGYKFFAGNSANGDKYKDTVYDSSDKNYYSCITTHTKSASSLAPSKDSANWKLDEKIEIVATSLLLAKKAIIKNLIAEGVQMYDKDGNNIVFDAQDGNLSCKTGTFDSIKVQNSELTNVNLEGSMRSAFQEAKNSFEGVNCDNYIAETTSGWTLFGATLTGTQNDIGRTIKIFAKNGGNLDIALSNCTVYTEVGRAITGHFYLLGRTYVELLGMGLNGTFDHWQVMRRGVFGSLGKCHGIPIGVLAYGVVEVTYSSSKWSISIDYESYDGLTLSVTRLGIGYYCITMPSSWKFNSNGIHVIATPYLPEYDTNGNRTLVRSANVMVTNIDLVDNKIYFSCADDDSRNDQSFFFEIKSRSELFWYHLETEKQS